MDLFDRTKPLNPEPDPAPTSARIAARASTSRLMRWAAGVGLAAILLGGGIAFGARMADSNRAVPASTVQVSNGQGTAVQGPALAAALGIPTSLSGLTATSVAHLPGGAHVRPAFAGLRRCVAAARKLRAAGHLAAARLMLRSCLRRYLRLRLLLLGVVHGQLTVKTRTGFRTIAFERGIVQTVTNSTVVVKTADQVTMTWNLIGKTVVIRARHKVGTGALTAGERVFVIGPALSGADDARLIVIRR